MGTPLDNERLAPDAGTRSSDLLRGQSMLRGLCLPLCLLISVSLFEGAATAESPPSYFKLVQRLNAKYSAQHSSWVQRNASALDQLQREESLDLNRMLKRHNRERAELLANNRSKSAEVSKWPVRDRIEFYRLQSLEYGKLTARHIKEHRELLKMYRDRRIELVGQYKDELQKIWEQQASERARLTSLYEANNTDAIGDWAASAEAMGEIGLTATGKQDTLANNVNLSKYGSSSFSAYRNYQVKRERTNNPSFLDWVKNQLAGAADIIVSFLIGKGQTAASNADTVYLGGKAAADLGLVLYNMSTNEIRDIEEYLLPMLKGKSLDEVADEAEPYLKIKNNPFKLLRGMSKKEQYKLKIRAVAKKNGIDL